MLKEINTYKVGQILNEWMKEIGEEYSASYNIKDNVLFLYSDRPGVLIGGGGRTINKYETLLKEAGVSKLTLVEVQNARIPEVKYGMKICPFDDPETIATLSSEYGDFADFSGLCYDHDRLGEIACMSCGASKAKQQQGIENFTRGMNNLVK